MRTFRFFIVALIGILIFSALAFAQTENVQINLSEKIGFIDSRKFYNEEKGIQELVDITKQTDLQFTSEFKSELNELEVLEEIFLNLSKELNIPSHSANYNDDVIIDEVKTEQFNTSMNEYIKMSVEVSDCYKKRKRDAEYSVRHKIARALRQFTYEKGYTAIVDINEIENSTFTTIFEGTPDITSEFIDYYNSFQSNRQ